MQAAFLHITDIHFWQIVLNPLKLANKRALGNLNLVLRRRKHFHQHNAETYLDAVRETGVSCALLGGDFTSTADRKEFEKSVLWLKNLQKICPELLLIPGNHDVYTFQDTRNRSYQQHMSAFQNSLDLPSLTRLASGVQVISAPTVCPNLLSSKGRITPAEIEATLRLVRDAPPGPLVLLAHYPVLHKTYAYASTASRQLRNAEQFRIALGEIGRPILYLAGHVHRFSNVRDPHYPQIQHLCTPAFFMHRPGTDVYGAFTEVHAQGDNFEVFLHEKREKWQRVLRPICDMDGRPI